MVLTSCVVVTSSHKLLCEDIIFRDMEYNM